MCAVVCAEGSDGHFCSSSILMHLSFLPVLSSSSGATNNRGFALLGTQEVCQEGSALLLMGAGGSLPGSFQLLLFVKVE